MHSTVDRFAWPVVAVLLLFAVATVAASLYQTRATTNAWRARDRAEAITTARFVGDYLERRLGEQGVFLEANTEAFQPGRDTELRRRVQATYFDQSPTYVLGVVVTDADGDIVVASERRPGMFVSPTLQRDIEAVARSAAGNGVPVVSGAIRAAGRLAYAHASPLSGISPDHGAWVVVYDLRDSPVGAYFDDRSSIIRRDSAVLDDQGRLMVGSKLRSFPGGIVKERVDNSSWTVAQQRPPLPPGVPSWALGMLLVGMLVLGAWYWLQEATRRSLRADAEGSAERVRKLYEFASAMLRGRAIRDQSSELARAIVDATEATGVRVRVARERDLSGVVSGEADRRNHRYRLAITGPRGPLGEVMSFTVADRMNSSDRTVVQTMAAMAGAAMHTQMVLERERTHASELQRLDELRTNLLSTVAHELRSPLTAVKGVLDLMSMRQDLSDKQREYVSVASERVDSLVDLIKDLFDCSLLESGQLDIRLERHLATQVLQNALGAMATSRPDDVYLSATPNLQMTVDPLRFDQILNNLVTNAFRHGNPPIEVLIRPYADGACLIVADDGPGIPIQERDRIFDKFHQSDAGNARLVEGTGLGLALVHGLVRLHGGRIEVDSTRLDGRGARFTIYFPDVAQVQDDASSGQEPEDELELLRQII